MTDYVKSTAFASKDALLTGNPLKIVKGTEIDTEFNNLQTVSITKADLFSPAFTGIPTAATAVSGTSTTQLATTAFATAAGGVTGSMLMWPVVTAPTGFLLCSGSAVSRTTYATLFAVVGVIFGAGDGSTTFNLPDYRDRMPVGAGTTYTAAVTGGSKDALVVTHTHTATFTGTALGTHNHQLGSRDSTASDGGSPNQEFVNDFGAGNGSPVTTSSVSAGTPAGTVSVTSAGASGTNANLPPYIGIYFIIKT